MRILIAEDEPDIWRPYKIALEYRNHEVIIAENGDQCLKIYNEEFLRQADKTLSPLLSTQTLSSSHNESNIMLNEATRNYYYSDTKNFDPSVSLHPSSTSNSSSTSPPPFDAVVLDYRMPGKDGMEVAKEILTLNPQQRIIFASAYVKETLEDSVKQLKQVVELMQKPFDAEVLADTIEDKEVHDGIKKLMTNLRQTAEYHETEPTLEQVRDLFEGLRKIQKGRTF